MRASNRIKIIREASKKGNKVEASDYKNKMSVQVKDAIKDAHDS